MRRLILLAALALVLAACGSSGSKPAPKGPVTFGIEGGTMIPFTATISSSGAVHETTGMFQLKKHHVSAAQLAAIGSDFTAASSRQCPQTLPDIGARYVIMGSQKVTVHGNCEPEFEKLWSEISSAVGLA